ncbi:MAG: polysaccharide pyruvyl transferase family protein [Cyanobacteria bacterium J06638_22]
MQTPFQRLHKRVVVEHVTNLLNPRAPLAPAGEKSRALPPLADNDWVVPLTWAGTNSQHPYANLGDALSPIVVSALSGLPIAYHRFESSRERMAAVGTIAHKFAGGTVHFWGTGLNPWRGVMDTQGRYELPPNTTFEIHAMRGPASANHLRRRGLEVPEVYGDPVWFTPKIFPAATEKRYELGVILHVAELHDAGVPDELPQIPKIKRYQMPSSLKEEQVKLLTTVTEPTLDSIEAQIREITACKRIASTSLHGLVLAEAYGIPCVYLPYAAGQGQTVSMIKKTSAVDYRMRDFYLGLGVKQRFIFGQMPDEPTPWHALIQAIDHHWTLIDWSPEAFLEAFPLPLAFNPLSDPPLFEQPESPQRSILSRIRF